MAEAFIILISAYLIHFLFFSLIYFISGHLVYLIANLF